MLVDRWAAFDENAALPPGSDGHAGLFQPVAKFAEEVPVNRDRQRFRRKLLFWSAGACLAVYLIALPVLENWTVESRLTSKNGRVLEDMTFAEHARVLSMEVFCAGWFAGIGAAIGSFLNVVVYRLPRGESPVLQRSRCPYCANQILGRDNIPILGWLHLKGRCRVCRLPISPRYPLVEASVAGLFLLLYFIELISGGANIPFRPPNIYRGAVWIIFYTKWDLVRLYFYHCYLLCLLLVWGLIGFDGCRIPLRSILIGLTIAAVLPLVSPSLQPVPGLANPPAFATMSPRMASLTTLCLGVLGGLGVSVLQFLTSLPWRDAGSPRLQTNSWPALVLIGVGLGWQAVLGVAVLASVLRLLLLVATRLIKGLGTPRILPLSYLAAALLHHLAWRWTLLVGAPWWQVSASTATIATLHLGLLSICNVAGQCLIEAQRDDAAEGELIRET